MKVVFFGTPPIAAYTLDFLLNQKEVTVSAIVTRPDRPQGRRAELKPSAVKQLALSVCPDIPLYQPEKASADEFVAEMAKYEPDFFVVIAYGEIVGQRLLDIPKILPINIHASLLPKYRGAAPIQRCLMDGAKESGVTIMEMVRKMDAGDMLDMVKIPISDEMTAGDLEVEMEKVAGPAVVTVMEKFKGGEGRKIPQNEENVTYAPKILGEDRLISWELCAREIHNQIRALSPRPGAYCQVKIQGVTKRLIIRRSRALEEVKSTPKATLKFENGEWIVGCGSGALSLLELQLEGKKSLPIGEFLLGFSSPLKFV
ncbi:MAG: Methionyl-tRNA formyltransferase [Chlamydiae bacterium]|nr:Methionyl-tRNA formyltransferase [Chlamydiota bacterium]